MVRDAATVGFLPVALTSAVVPVIRLEVRWDSAVCISTRSTASSRAMTRRRRTTLVVSGTPLTLGCT